MKANLFFVNALLYFISTDTEAALCEDISGRWVNIKLGSEVEFEHLQHGVLRGKYYTAVSSSGKKLPGHAVMGSLPYNKPGSSFAFSVTWQNGSSTTVWTGQCLVCNGKETLETSWLLRSFVDSCVDVWMSTRIGKDVFERKQYTVENIHQDLKIAHQLPSPNRCNLSGVWYNDVGSEVILNQTTDGTISGEYRTAVERETGSAGTSHSLVYGSSSYGNPNTTFALMVIWRGGKSVTGWVGQCHICENNTVTLEMGWLLRSKIDNCGDVWKSTMYGVNSFTRHEQKAGPRKSLDTHTPNRDGEDIDDGSSSLKVSSIMPVLIGFLLIWIIQQ